MFLPKTNQNGPAPLYWNLEKLMLTTKEVRKKDSFACHNPAIKTEILMAVL